MIVVKFKPKTYEVTVTGHAGQNKKGKDIVCSAISILFYTLGDSLMKCMEMMEEEPVVKDDDGYGYAICKPKEEYVANIEMIYWTVLNGVQLVAETYGKYVKLVIEEND
ncbi:MAG: ribosomal-processing cysteine protease Prp [Lachnospiraceae bacterium]|nr:ribosomal-processing cysteine protease Prp [Lachnospiraceae bacterium]